MKRYIKTALLIIASAFLAASCGNAGHDLVILHLNDTHSHLDPHRDGTAGVIERTAFIDSVRKAEGPSNVLLLHAGDFDQGSSYFTILGGNLEVDLINAMGYDCVALGNHEFDNGIEDLGMRVAKLKCPVVCCNYDFSPFEAGKYIKPYAIVEKAGRRIGIVGAICNISTVVSSEISERMPPLETVTEINRWADYLKEKEGCDLVILLSHLGFKGRAVSDVTLIPQTRSIDIVVGGHSHTKLDKIYEVKNADGRTIPVVQDWDEGRQVGLLRVK